MAGPPRPDADPPQSLSALAVRAVRDQAAFEQLHARLTPGLARFFLERAPRRPELAEELAQRTWTGVWESLRAGRYDPTRSAFSTYCYAVASNIWLQHLRAQPGPRSPLDADVAFTIGDDPARLADAAEILDAVRTLLTTPHPDLPETDRWIIRLSATGHPDRDIAAKLGIAASTLNERKKQAYASLKRILNTKGFRTSAPPPGPAARDS